MKRKKRLHRSLAEAERGQIKKWVIVMNYKSIGSKVIVKKCLWIGSNIIG